MPGEHSNLEGFVEEVFKASGDADDEAERVSDDVEAEDDDVGLPDGLARVMADHFSRQILRIKFDR